MGICLLSGLKIKFRAKLKPAKREADKWRRGQFYDCGLDIKTSEGYSLGMSKFIQSASSLATCPRPTGKEIAFLGRSNAGKSSLINSLLQHRLAKTSSKPGHTRLLNFFWDSRRELVLVDLPGYGYTMTSKESADTWRDFIEEYLKGREHLSGYVLVMDIRRDWGPDEEALLDWLDKNRPLPFVLALTKIDKLNQSEKVARLRYFEQFKDFF